VTHASAWRVVYAVQRRLSGAFAHPSVRWWANRAGETLEFPVAGTSGEVVYTLQRQKLLAGRCWIVSAFRYAEPNIPVRTLLEAVQAIQAHLAYRALSGL